MSDITEKLEDLPSGRFVLRLPRELHGALRRSAREAGLSLNDYCVRRLAAPAPPRGHGELAAVVDRATALLGVSLVGLIAFGSWARGEAIATSDVDILVVVDSDFPLTRRVYHDWDAQPLRVEGRPVEVHLVRLPAPASAVTGVWAEAAIDGHVIVERGFVLAAHLAAVRRALLGGHVQRRTVHGQPYWTEVAQMRNQELAADYVRRAAVRLRALDVLFDAASWADVVRESQEVVELGLKGLLRACGVEPPRVHDVSEVLRLERGRLPSGVEPHVEALANASRALRRDLELAYYGAEDLTPSGFYTRDDAVAARNAAAFVIGVVRPAVLGE